MQERLQQAQRLESLGVLAGGIAHDFNNLLMAILGHADLAMQELSPLSPVLEDVEAIRKSSVRAADLCAQLLAYAGKGKTEEKSFSISELVDEMSNMIKTCISKKCILNMQLEKALPLVNGDPSQMRQIILNFVLNASEAIGERSGVINVSTGAMQCSGDYLSDGYLIQPLESGLYVTIEVSDTGCGMTQETLSRIFEPFYTTKFTGRGLGLSAVMGIIRSHGGGLRVYSEPGKGTTFKVLLPAVEGEADRETLKPGSKSGSGGEWRGAGTVLLVDDEESVRAISAKLLNLLGLEVLIAENGLQALDIYREKQKDIDLVILDLTMPKMDGAETFRGLRAIDQDVKVVLASGYSEKDVATRFAGKKLSACVQKPYSLDKLREILPPLLDENTRAK